MGWSGTGCKTIAELKSEIKCDFLGRCKKISSVGTVIYAAVEKKDGSGVFCYIGKTRKEGKELFVKDMDDTMGPTDAKCPDSILNLLSPTDNDIAIAWRERCKTFNQRK